jgi:hypothetical protein
VRAANLFVKFYTNLSEKKTAFGGPPGTLPARYRGESPF